MTKKKIIKKIKWKVIVKIGFLLFAFFLVFLFFLQLKIKNILIIGNDLVSDQEIILSTGIKDYPKIFSLSLSQMKENLLNNPYIHSVKIKRSLTGTLTFEIEENTPILFNRNNNRLVLSSHEEIQTENLYGVPILVNYVPDTFYDPFIDELFKVQKDVLPLISEIEYQPWKRNDVMIDETRFFLRMNDGNSVYVNLLHMDKLNKYIEIFATLEGHQGILYLDSASDKISFSDYKAGE